MGEANIREQASIADAARWPRRVLAGSSIQTDALEYLDRDDVPDEVKQKIIRCSTG